MYNGFGSLIEMQAKRLSAPLLMTATVMKLICGTQGFTVDTDVMIVEFMVNVFFNHFTDYGKNTTKLAAFDQYFKFTYYDETSNSHYYRSDPSSSNWIYVHNSQPTEWEALVIAQRLCESFNLTDADALYAARYVMTSSCCMKHSMGASRIMGYNHVAAGYATVQSMFVAFSKSLYNQLCGFFNFVKVCRT